MSYILLIVHQLQGRDVSKVLYANKMSDLTEVISDEVEATDNLVPRAKRASEEWVREIDT